ncbi:hypothetical protein ACFPFV_12520 [Salinicoccus siamensis]|uniref:hypothetical protein n=1 Tax=Salinicoccus siamensis TaxID=381830 RepID=UPI003610AA3B
MAREVKQLLMRQFEEVQDVNVHVKSILMNRRNLSMTHRKVILDCDPGHDDAIIDHHRRFSTKQPGHPWHHHSRRECRSR